MDPAPVGIRTVGKTGPADGAGVIEAHRASANGHARALTAAAGDATEDQAGPPHLHRAVAAESAAKRRRRTVAQSNLVHYQGAAAGNVDNPAVGGAAIAQVEMVQRNSTTTVDVQDPAPECGLVVGVDSHVTVSAHALAGAVVHGLGEGQIFGDWAQPFIVDAVGNVNRIAATGGGDGVADRAIRADGAVEPDEGIRFVRAGVILPAHDLFAIVADETEMLVAGVAVMVVGITRNRPRVDEDVVGTRRRIFNPDILHVVEVVEIGT